MINKNTGYTRYELQFGRESNHVFSKEDDKLALQKQIDNLHIQYKNKLEKTHRNMIRIPTKSYTPIENNDLIFVKNFNAKFEPQWKGLFPVIRQIHNLTCSRKHRN